MWRCLQTSLRANPLWSPWTTTKSEQEILMLSTSGSAQHEGNRRWFVHCSTAQKYQGQWSCSLCNTSRKTNKWGVVAGVPHGVTTPMQTSAWSENPHPALLWGFAQLTVILKSNLAKCSCSCSEPKENSLLRTRLEKSAAMKWITVTMSKQSTGIKRRPVESYHSTPPWCPIMLWVFIGQTA